jgi:hypothetical protein
MEWLRIRRLIIPLAFAGATAVAFLVVTQRDHTWPQEPDAFGGMKLGATKVETEKVVRLEGCQTVRFDNLSCKTLLDVAGRTLQADVLFGVPHSPSGVPTGEGHLVGIYCDFDTADFARVKAAFIKKYGSPQRRETARIWGGAESLSWAGNNAGIGLWSRANTASLSFTRICHGCKVYATLEAQIPAQRPK